MRKGTFSVKKAGSNSAAHNSRENAPKYLIGLSPGTQNYYELIQSDNDFILEAQQIYKTKIGQSMQKKQIPNLVQETVLTLQPNQNENDVKELFKKLNKKYGGHEILEVSVHRDEGHFLKDEIAYYPTKNILKKDNEYFIKSNPDLKVFDKKVDINTFEKVYNYHAHVKFSMFDKELGKSARMQKKDMSERIKFVSQELGLLFAPEKETSRIKKNVNQVKNEYHAKAKTQEKIKYNFREMQQKITSLENASVEDKKELHKLNSQVKNDKATIEELHSKISEYQEEKKEIVKALTPMFNKLKEEKKEVPQNAIKFIKFVDEELNNQKTLINSLKTQNNDLREELVQKEIKINSTAKQLTLKSNTIKILDSKNQVLESKLQKAENFIFNIAKQLGCENSYKSIALAFDKTMEHAKKHIDRVKNLISKSQEMQSKSVNLEDVRKANNPYEKDYNSIPGTVEEKDNSKYIANILKKSNLQQER